MDDDAATDQRQKELSISLTASSMINGLDMISEEAYQANLRRIQEVKEMVHRLEMNNESAHKNFVVSQLEKRARDGREAENILAQLRDEPGLPEIARFTNNVSSGKSEVILPTTATLVEVPDSHSSYSSPVPTTTFHPQLVQQGRPSQYQWNPATQVRQNQSYNPDVFRHYVPPHAVRQPPLLGALPRSRGLTSGQGWYAAQNVPLQSGVHNPVAHQPGFQPEQAQHTSQSNSYPPPVIALSAADTVPAPGYHTFQSEHDEAAPGHSSPSPDSPSTSRTTCREPGFPIKSTELRPAVTHNQLQNLPSPAPLSQVRAPLHSVPVPLGKAPSSQPPPDRSQPPSTTVSKPIAISQLQRLHNPSQQAQPQSQPQPQHLQQPSQPPPLPQLHQPPSGPPSRRPLQLNQSHPQATPQSAGRLPTTSVTHPHGRSSHVHEDITSPGTPQAQLTQPTIVQAQARLQGVQPSLDRATFIKLFQIAVQRGILHFKAFYYQAKSTGISDEWFKAAVDALPRDVWQSFAAQANQSGPRIDVPSSASVPRQQAIAGLNAPLIPVRPSPTTTPLVQRTPAFQQVAKPNTPPEGRSSVSEPGQTSETYAAQLRYYAEQAAKSVLSVQMAGTPTPMNIASTRGTDATPTRDVPQTQAQANVRTPQHANKSTLARDILRSLGKIAPKPRQETRIEATDNTSNHEGDGRPEVNAPPRLASPKHLVDPQETSFVAAHSSSVGSNTRSELSHMDVSTTQSTAKEEFREAVITGPIMIDLTLEDSDESVGENGPEAKPTFLIQTSTSAATSSQPVSPSNTTNHTPLLKNLSLEEPSDNADVRMHSPPLSQAAGKNMESEPLHPPLGRAESVPPIFETLPREPADGQLPLFLPSPPASPAHTEPPETDVEMTSDEGKSRPSLKRRSVDVDETEIDIAPLKSPRIRKRPKQRVYVLIPPAAPHVKRAIKKMRERAMEMDGGADLERGDDEEIQYSHLEQLLIEECKSWLSERRCLWVNCGVVMNCAVNLLAHLKNHAREADSQAPFLCRWANCRKQFDGEQERDAHLERHSIRPLPCPFAGCIEQFGKPVEVMQHEMQHQQAEHKESLVRKPTHQPVVPAIPARLGPPPPRLPSHRVIPRRVVKCRISAERHATMGPWVLWNIFSPVELNRRKQNASMRARPTRQAVQNEVDSSDPRRDDYDFLLALSSHPAKNVQLDDLDSTLITMSAARGLTLWGSGSAVNSVTGTATPEVVSLSVEGVGKGVEVGAGGGRAEAGQEPGLGLGGIL